MTDPGMKCGFGPISEYPVAHNCLRLAIVGPAPQRAYGTLAVDTLTCGPNTAMARPGAAFTLAALEKVCCVQFDEPASLVDTVVPPATNVPAGVAAICVPEFS